MMSRAGQEEALSSGDGAKPACPYYVLGCKGVIVFAKYAEFLAAISSAIANSDYFTHSPEQRLSAIEPPFLARSHRSERFSGCVYRTAAGESVLLTYLDSDSPGPQGGGICTTDILHRIQPEWAAMVGYCAGLGDELAKNVKRQRKRKAKAPRQGNGSAGAEDDDSAMEEPQDKAGERKDEMDTSKPGTAPPPNPTAQRRRKKAVPLQIGDVAIAVQGIENLRGHMTDGGFVRKVNEQMHSIPRNLKNRVYEAVEEHNTAPEYNLKARWHMVYMISVPFVDEAHDWYTTVAHYGERAVALDMEASAFIQACGICNVDCLGVYKGVSDLANSLTRACSKEKKADVVRNCVSNAFEALESVLRRDRGSAARYDHVEYVDDRLKVHNHIKKTRDKLKPYLKAEKQGNKPQSSVSGEGESGVDERDDATTPSRPSRRLSTPRKRPSSAEDARPAPTVEERKRVMDEFVDFVRSQYKEEDLQAVTTMAKAYLASKNLENKAGSSTPSSGDLAPSDPRKRQRVEDAVGKRSEKRQHCGAGSSSLGTAKAPHDGIALTDNVRLDLIRTPRSRCLTVADIAP